MPAAHINKDYVNFIQNNYYDKIPNPDVNNAYARCLVSCLKNECKKGTDALCNLERTNGNWLWRDFTNGKELFYCDPKSNLQQRITNSIIYGQKVTGEDIPKLFTLSVYAFYRQNFDDAANKIQSDFDIKGDTDIKILTALYKKFFENPDDSQLDDSHYDVFYSVLGLPYTDSSGNRTTLNKQFCTDGKTVSEELQNGFLRAILSSPILVSLIKFEKEQILKNKISAGLTSSNLGIIASVVHRESDKTFKCRNAIRTFYRKVEEHIEEHMRDKTTSFEETVRELLKTPCTEFDSSATLQVYKAIISAADDKPGTAPSKRLYNDFNDYIDRTVPVPMKNDGEQFSHGWFTGVIEYVVGYMLLPGTEQKKFCSMLLEDANDFRWICRPKQLGAIYLLSLFLHENFHFSFEERKTVFEATYGKTCYHFQYRSLKNLLSCSQFYAKHIIECRNASFKYDNRAPLFFFYYGMSDLYTEEDKKDKLLMLVKDCSAFRGHTYKKTSMTLDEHLSVADELLNRLEGSYRLIALGKKKNIPADDAKRLAEFGEYDYRIFMRKWYIAAHAFLYGLANLHQKNENYKREHLVPLYKDFDKSLLADEEWLKRVRAIMIWCDSFQRSSPYFKKRIKAGQNNDIPDYWLPCGALRFSCEFDYALCNIKEKIPLTQTQINNYDINLQTENLRYGSLVCRMIAVSTDYSDKTEQDFSWLTRHFTDKDNIAETAKEVFGEYDYVDPPEFAEDINRINRNERPNFNWRPAPRQSRPRILHYDTSKTPIPSSSPII